MSRGLNHPHAAPLWHDTTPALIHNRAVQHSHAVCVLSDSASNKPVCAFIYQDRNTSLVLGYKPVLKWAHNVWHIFTVKRNILYSLLQWWSQSQSLWRNLVRTFVIQHCAYIHHSRTHTRCEWMQCFFFYCKDSQGNCNGSVIYISNGQSLLYDLIVISWHRLLHRTGSEALCCKVSPLSCPN